MNGTTILAIGFKNDEAIVVREIFGLFLRRLSCVYRKPYPH
jgi:hypothetical protein